MDNLQAVKEQLAGVELECGVEAGAGEEPSEPGGVYEPAEPRLLSMPVEIILKICSFLDADFLKNTLTKVCRRFETILADSHIWRYWVHSKLDGGCYPPLPQLASWAERPVDWPGVCADMARERRKWENIHDTTRHVVLKDVHIASVDTVLLVDNGSLCVSGGRDRGMALWSVRDVAGEAGEAGAARGAAAAGGGSKPRQLRADAHEGWVWDLAADSLRDTALVYSASWDNTVKAWDLRTGLTRLETFRADVDIVKLKMDNLQAVKEQLAGVELECGVEAGAGEEPSEPGGVYEPAEPRLLSMPVEIILKICSFLDADFLKNTLTKVCRRFETILADSHIWRYWVHSKLDGGCYPPLPQLASWAERPVDWPGVCADMARERRKWENIHDTTRHVVLKDVHIASVDTVLLVDNGSLCVSGGRDRGMALWSVRDVAGEAGEAGAARGAAAAGGGSKPRQLRADAHEGWVWDLAADSLRDTALVYSASWDNTVKAWDLRTGLTRLETFRCGMSALSVAASGDAVLAGLYSKRVLSFDRRAGPRPVASYKSHRGPVLALTLRDNKVASVSEDKTLAVWDLVAGRALVTDVALPGARAYPVCLSWSRAALYVGDSKGSLHTLHPTELRLVRSHAVWAEQAPAPACKLTGCVQAAGSLLLCSDRGDIKFLYNSCPPRQYAQARSATRDVTQMRYLNDILAIGTCDSALELWLPAALCAAAVHGDC